VLYAHFREGSLNPDLLAVGAQVSEGQFLSCMGNSGSSTGSHLHIHALDDASGFFRPLQFRGGWVVDLSAVSPDDLSAPWVKLEGHGLPFGPNAIWPSDFLPVSITRLDSAEHLPTDRFRIVALDADLLAVAFAAADGRLRLVAAAISADRSSLGFLGDSGDLAGTVGLVEVASLGFGLVVTAVTTAKGRLKLIVWRISDGGSTIRRFGDSGNEAGMAGAISLTSLGTGHLVTAVRTKEGREKVILWRVSADGSEVERLGDSGNDGVEADLMAAAPAGLGRFVTVARNGEQRLLVEVWQASADGSGLTRLSDSSGQAGSIGEVRALSLGATQLVTAVRTQSGRLKLIVWDIDEQG
jgi:hypothetical protein